MAKTGIVVLLTIVAFLLLTGMASSDSPFTCTFTGTVQMDGADAADGTIITVIIDGNKYTTATTTGYGASAYTIEIQPPDGMMYPEGTEVTFKVNNHPADQTGTWKAGQSIRLDLTASTTSSPSSPSTNVWLLVGLIVACVITASLVGAVAYIMYHNWNR